jgi:hypothetical protein
MYISQLWEVHYIRWTRDNRGSKVLLSWMNATDLISYFKNLKGEVHIKLTYSSIRTLFFSLNWRVPLSDSPNFPASTKIHFCSNNLKWAELQAQQKNITYSCLNSYSSLFALYAASNRSGMEIKKLIKKGERRALRQWRKWTKPGISRT